MENPAERVRGEIDVFYRHAVLSWALIRCNDTPLLVTAGSIGHHGCRLLVF